MKGAAVLFSEMTPEIDWEDRFNVWAEGHDIPRRMEIPGILSAARYRDTERATYLSLYELRDAGVLESPEYTAFEEHPNIETRWIMENAADYSRYVGEETSDQRQPALTEDPLDAPILYSVFFSVPDERAEEFDSWYTDEHVPLLLGCRDWLMCRRFLIHEGDPQPWTHLALHYLDDIAALDSPEREAARSTEWRESLAAEPWFQAGTVVFRRHGGRYPAGD